MDHSESLYQILGIKQDASFEDIKRAYRDKCFILHPDRMLGLPESTKKRAEEELIRVNRAFAVLKDAQKRKTYDMQMSGKASSSTKPPQPTAKTKSKPQPKPKSEQQANKSTNQKKVIVDTKWMAVMVLSTFFGFLALDRFFLRQYKWAIWKLLTLGGLGMWWIADVIYFGIKGDDLKSAFRNTSQLKNYSRIIAVGSTSWLIIACVVILLLFVPSLNVRPVVSIQANNSIVGTTFTGKGTGFSQSGGLYWRSRVRVHHQIVQSRR